MAVQTEKGRITVNSLDLYDYVKGDRTSLIKYKEQKGGKKTVSFNHKEFETLPKIHSDRASIVVGPNNEENKDVTNESHSVVLIKEKLSLPPILVKTSTGVPTKSFERRMIDEVKTRRLHPQTRTHYTLNRSPIRRWRHAFRDLGNHASHPEIEISFKDEDTSLVDAPNLQSEIDIPSVPTGNVKYEMPLAPTGEEVPPSPQSESSSFVSDVRKYPFRKRPRGFAIVINNYEFYNEMLVMGPSGPSMIRVNQKRLRREGSVADSEKLQNFLMEEGFIVKSFSNLTANEMLGVFFNVSRTDHTGLESFFCFLASHGREGSLFGSDCREIKIADLTTMVDSSNCLSLSRKPKCFYIQGCKGEHGNIKGKGYSFRSNIERHLDDSTHHIPRTCDYLLCYSMSQGCTKYHTSQRGSLLFQFLIKCIQKFKQRYDLRTMTEKTTNMVGKHLLTAKPGISKEIIVVESNLREKIFFDD